MKTGRRTGGFGGQQKLKQGSLIAKEKHLLPIYILLLPVFIVSWLKVVDNHTRQEVSGSGGGGCKRPVKER